MELSLQHAHEAVTAAISDMTLTDLARHQPGKWSTAEILEHLILAFDGTCKLLGWLSGRAKSKPEAPTDDQRRMINLILNEGKFPPGQEAPPFAVPRGADVQSLQESLEASFAQLDFIVAKCEQLFGADATLGRHQVLGPLTGKEWCKYHFVHVGHHVRQIEEIKRWLRHSENHPT